MIRPIPASDSLVDAHIGMAVKIATQIGQRLPPHVDRDDVESAAMIGLMHAARAFDPSLGAKFTTFAAKRVHGAIMDFLRENSPLSRTRVQIEKSRFEFSDRFFAEHGRPPTADELDAAVPRMAGAFTEELSFSQLEREANDGDLLSLTAALCDKTSVVGDVDQENFAGLIHALPIEQRRLLTRYYCDNLSMHDVGRELGVSESRVSQMHKEAINQLRINLAGMDLHRRTTPPAVQVKRPRPAVTEAQREANRLAGIKGRAAKLAKRQRTEAA